MATRQDVIQTLERQTREGKITWTASAESRWETTVEDCRFSLMERALDIDEGKGWYRLKSPDGLDFLVKAVRNLFPSQKREDEVLENALDSLNKDDLDAVLAHQNQRLSS